jgi:hypothetical protein
LSAPPNKLYIVRKLAGYVTEGTQEIVGAWHNGTLGAGLQASKTLPSSIFVLLHRRKWRT